MDHLTIFHPTNQLTIELTNQPTDMTHYRRILAHIKTATLTDEEGEGVESRLFKLRILRCGERGKKRSIVDLFFSDFNESK